MRKLKLFLDAKAANTPPRGISKASRIIFSVLTLLFLSIGQVWAVDDVINNAATSSALGSTGTTTWKNPDPVIVGASGASYTIHSMGTQGTSNALQFNKNGFLYQTTSGGTLASVTIKGAAKKFNIYASNSAYSEKATGTALTQITASSTGVTYTFTSNYKYLAINGTESSSSITEITVTYSTSGGDPVPVTGVSLDEDDIVLEVGETQTLVATIEPGEATDQVVSWESDDENVASVDENGVVTAEGIGTATITVTTHDGDFTATCDVEVIAAQPKSSLILEDEYKDSGATAEDGAEWVVTSDAPESVYEAARGIHFGTGSSSQVQYVQLTTLDISGTITKVVVNASDATGTAEISVSVGGTDFTCSGSTTVANTNPGSNYTFTGSASGEIVVLIDRGDAAYKAIYVKSVIVSYIADQKQPAGLAYNEADQKNEVKLGNTFTAPELTNPNGLSVSYASNNTAVAEVASNGDVTIKAVGFAEITASFAGNDDYKAGSAKYTIGVVEHEGTLTDPYSVADAKAVIDALGGKENVYATGIVSTANLNQDNIDQYHNASYWISDDGTTANQLEAFRGRYLENEDITSVTDILVEDEVVIYGTLTKHDDIYEFAAGNYLISLNRNKAEAGLNYATKAIEKEINAAAFTNDLSNPNNLTVTYTSSDENLATVDENGEVTVGNEDGVVTITASTTGDATHLAGTATYTLTIVNPSLTKVTFDATLASDIAEDNDEGVTKSGVNIKTSHTDGVNDQSNPISYYQCFKNANLTVTSTVGNIKKIEFVTTGGSYTSDGFAGVSNDKWTGNASEVVLTASGHQVRMSKITVSYIPDNRSAAGLAWSTDAIELTVGDEFTAPTLSNPNNIAAAEIAIESDNENLAEINAGVVSLVADATGTATITATFNGNDDYKPAIVSYTITVNEAGLDNITFDATVDIAGTNELSISKSGFTLEFTNGAMGNGENYRLYKNQTMTLSSTDYKIKKIEFTCTTDKPIVGFADDPALDKDNNQWTGDANSVSLTASNEQVRMTLLKVYYVEDTRAASGLAWSTDEVEITLGDPFTAASLVNPNSIDAAEITIESSNTNLAIVENGVVSLVEDVTGTATITATFAGNATYKPANISYTITVNDPNPEISTDVNSRSWTVDKDAAIPADKTFEVTLKNIASATVTLGGTNPDAFSITPATLTASGNITVSVVSTATVGTYTATITIKDDASEASKDVNVNLTVNEPEAQETSVSTSSEWVVATAVADGMEVLITGVKDDVTYAMSVQSSNGNNRTTAAGSVNGDIFTPGENTMSFTLVAQEGDNKYALRTSNEKYLFASSGSANRLGTRDEIGDDGKTVWTISIGEGNVASIVANCETTNWRNTMRFNQNGQNNPVVACYASASQDDIKLYVPKQDTPVEPVYEDARTGLTPGHYYTICLPKKVTDFRGASVWNMNKRNAAETEVYLEEAELPFAAGTPFIIQAIEDKLEVVYEGAAVTEPVANGALRGTLTGFTIEQFDALTGNVYILKDNAIRPRMTGQNYLSANRAYILYNELVEVAETPLPAPGRRVVAMPMQGQTATGCENIQAGEAPVKMMIDGQLFIIRGEKMYDTTGRLVK